MEPTTITLPADKALRAAWFTAESFEHPAKIHLGFLLWLAARYTAPGDTVCDPMAGIGSVLLLATIRRNILARELEAGWAEACRQNAAAIRRRAGLLELGTMEIAQGDAAQPWGVTCDAVLMSPPYGCRATRNPEARVGTLPHRVRALNAASMGERWQAYLAAPTAGAAGALRFHYGDHPDQIGHLRGKRYWAAMQAVYLQAHAAIRPGGKLILVLKDHIHRGVHMRTCDQAVVLCEALGFRLVDRVARQLTTLSLWQRRRREKGEPIIDVEEALVFEKVLA